jgi:hypothetical protein
MQNGARRKKKKKKKTACHENSSRGTVPCRPGSWKAGSRKLNTGNVLHGKGELRNPSFRLRSLSFFSGTFLSRRQVPLCALDVTFFVMYRQTDRHTSSRSHLALCPRPNWACSCTIPLGQMRGSWDMGIGVPRNWLYATSLQSHSRDVGTKMGEDLYYYHK